MYTPQDINNLLEIYIKSPQGKSDMQAKGVTLNMYSEAEVIGIAEQLKNEIIETFLTITSHVSYVDARDYFSKVSVGKIRHLKAGDKISINFSPRSLYRPSLMRRNGTPTGGGIQDIFSLITNGTGKSAKLYGYWTYFSEGMGYGAEEVWTKAWLPRRAKPFIQNIVNKYEARFPGVIITIPEEWN